MTIAAQGGIFSYAVQPSKIGRDGSFDASALDWFKIRSPRVAVGTVQDQQVFALETGGPLTPSGSYKQGYFFAGEVDLFPRIKNSLGWLLLGAMGAASSVEDTTADAASQAGVNTHIFRFDPTSPSFQPWMAVRRVVPGRVAGQNFGETGFDCKINSLRLTIPAAGKLALRTSMVGRDVVYDNAAAWVYENATFEDTATTPDAGRGQFLIGGVEYPILGATIEVMNNLSTPQQERIIGDFRPDDFIALSRAAQIRIVYKYENANLYRQLLTGQSNGSEWSSLPFTNTSGGSGYAFDARFQAPANIGATSVPYTLRCRANRVTWAVEGPIELQAGGIITQSFVGTIEEPASGDYFQFTLENDATGYPIPS